MENRPLAFHLFFAAFLYILHDHPSSLGCLPPPPQSPSYNTSGGWRERRGLGRTSHWQLPHRVERLWEEGGIPASLYTANSMHDDHNAQAICTPATMPRACIWRSQCPGHVYDDHNAQGMYMTSTMPRACIWRAQCPGACIWRPQRQGHIYIYIYDEPNAQAMCMMDNKKTRREKSGEQRAPVAVTLTFEPILFSESPLLRSDQHHLKNIFTHERSPLPRLPLGLYRPWYWTGLASLFRLKGGNVNLRQNQYIKTIELLQGQQLQYGF